MGLAVGTNDLDLLRRAAKNFGVATLISVPTATVYFLITPLGEAQSELLARTSPTLYDVSSPSVAVRRASSPSAHEARAMSPPA